MCVYIWCGAQPGLTELKHDGPLLSQEQMYKVYKGKKTEIFFPASGMI